MAASKKKVLVTPYAWRKVREHGGSIENNGISIASIAEDPVNDAACLTCLTAVRRHLEAVETAVKHVRAILSLTV